MPDIRLIEEEEEGDLPAVCMCCGAPATTWMRRRFMVQPPVVHGPSVFREIYAVRLLIATAQVPRMHLRTSFCRRHRNYWKLRAALIWGGLAGLLAILFGGIALIVFLLAVVKFDAPWLAGIVLGPLVVYLTAWITALAVVQPRSIRAQYATDGTEDVILHNVHTKYVEALERQRAQSRPARRGTADRALPEALPAASAVASNPIRKSPSNATETAAAYQAISDQLAKGTSPRNVEASLSDSGWDAETAQILVARVLEEMPGVLESRYRWQLYVSLGLFGVALLVAFGLGIALLAARSGSKGLLKLWVLALLWMFSQGYWAAVSIWKVWLAHRLQKARAAWLRASGLPVGLAVGHRSSLATATSSSADGSSALARRAIAARDTQRVQRLGAITGGSVALLFVLGCCCMVPLVAVVDRFRQSRDSENDSSISSKQQSDPNAPSPNEGPPPRGWTVLFRSDDPSVWNTDSPGPKFALPMRRAHSKIRYLRLKRLDTGEMLIVPITHKQLTRDERSDSYPGHWWNGTARQEWGGRRLGIAQVPSVGETKGQIGVALGPGGVYSGSGFGWKTYVNDKQYFCWQGREIPQTTFEVAVTTGPLTEQEKERFTGPDAEAGPQPAGWTVLFRSDDPSVWNTFSAGKNFALPVSRAHARIHYLRLTRLDTGEALILLIARKDLAREPDPAPEKGFRWCGSAKLDYGARHLGIIQAPRTRFPNVPHKRVCVMALGWDSYFGSGFGHMTAVDKGQFYSWEGQEIPRTAFEIAVSVGPLTREDKRSLLKMIR